MAKDITKEDFRRLIDGELPWDDVKTLIKTTPKSKDRFWDYIEILQDRVKFKDKILMPLTDHIYIVAKQGGGRVVKCSCGYDLGDYRINWKLSCLIRVRKGEEEVGEIYQKRNSYINPEIFEVREYYCPGCYVQLGVEVCPPGYPVIFEALPDLDAFYREWMGQALKDEDKSWFEDRTFGETAKWVTEIEQKKTGGRNG